MRVSRESVAAAFAMALGSSHRVGGGRSVVEAFVSAAPRAREVRGGVGLRGPRGLDGPAFAAETEGGTEMDSSAGAVGPPPAYGINGEAMGEAPAATAAAAAADGAEAEEEAERGGLKLSLLKLAAAYDRGYGSTSTSRGEVDRIVDRLEGLNPTADGARGISGDGGPAPLGGIWRMVWTTAQDVLTLASNPFVTVGSIYQVIEPPIVTNVIDLIPRAQALLPPGVAPSTLVRAEVTTRASPREGRPLRVGLDFEAVKIKPVEVLGVATEGLLPPLAFDLPRFIDVKDLPGVDPADPPGYFDVAYLDDEMLIIRQNAPGGLFVLVKAENSDP